MKKTKIRKPHLKHLAFALMAAAVLVLLMGMFGSYYASRIGRAELSSLQLYLGYQYRACMFAAAVLLAAGIVSYCLSGYSWDFWTVVGIMFLILCVLFIAYPMFNMLLRSVQNKNNEFTLDNFRLFAQKKRYYEALFNSLKVCTVTTVIAVALGLPIAYLSVRTNIWGKRIIHLMILLTMMSPPFIGAYSWITLFGSNGLITGFLAGFGINIPNIYGFKGIVLALSMGLICFVYLYVRGALNSIDASLEEAAANLGMNRFRRLFTVTLPLIMPTVGAAAIMVFMSSLADYGTPALIGQGYNVLPVMVYTNFMGENGSNKNFASALSIIVIAVALVILVIQKRLVERRNYNMSALHPIQEKKLSPVGRVLGTAYCFLICLIAVSPQIVVIATSFMKANATGAVFLGGFTLDNYRSIFRLSGNMLNTLKFSVVAVACMLLLGMLVSYLVVRRRSRFTGFLDLVVMFPYIIPGAILGIMMTVAFNRKPMILTGTSVILIISYTIRKMPYIVRSASAYLYTIDPSVEEASINLGVSPMRTFWKITARLMVPALASGGLIAWVQTVNELSSSLVLNSGSNATLAVLVYSYVNMNNYASGAAIGSILTYVTILSVIVFSIATRNTNIEV